MLPDLIKHDQYGSGFSTSMRIQLERLFFVEIFILNPLPYVSVTDPEFKAFFTPRSGMGTNPDPGVIFENLGSDFRVKKILKFF
jgi:hypothetical protein